MVVNVTIVLWVVFRFFKVDLSQRWGPAAAFAVLFVQGRACPGGEESVIRVIRLELDDLLGGHAARDFLLGQGGPAGRYLGSDSNLTFLLAWEGPKERDLLPLAFFGAIVGPVGRDFGSELALAIFLVLEGPVEEVELLGSEAKSFLFRELVELLEDEAWVCAVLIPFFNSLFSFLTSLFSSLRTAIFCSRLWTLRRCFFLGTASVVGVALRRDRESLEEVVDMMAHGMKGMLDGGKIF